MMGLGSMKSSRYSLGRDDKNSDLRIMKKPDVQHMYTKISTHCKFEMFISNGSYQKNSFAITKILMIKI